MVGELIDPSRSEPPYDLAERPMLESRLTVYWGAAGDHNDRAMSAVTELGAALAARLAEPAVTVGQPLAADPQGWEVELERARPALQTLAARLDDVFAAGLAPVTAITRCAVALATQPRMAAHHPEAVVLWLDAHGDLNRPPDTQTGYLGGMALSAPLGWWDTGLDGPAIAGAVLVGARDLDPAEAEHVRAGRVALVTPGPDLGARVADAVAGRPIYFHLDCDVLEPGIVRTDYAVPNGLSLPDLHECATAVAAGSLVGVEIGEYEGPASAGLDELLDALAPVLDF